MHIYILYIGKFTLINFFKFSKLIHINVKFIFFKNITYVYEIKWQCILTILNSNELSKQNNNIVLINI